MTKINMDLSDLLAKQDQGDFLRSIAEAVLQLIMEADVEGLIGAGRHEHSGDRSTSPFVGETVLGLFSDPPNSSDA